MKNSDTFYWLFFDKIMTKSLKFSDNPGQKILAKTLFFCIIQPNSEKTTFPLFQCCCLQAPCTAWRRTTLIIGGRRNFLFLPQFLSRVVVTLHKKWSFPLRISSVNVTVFVRCHILEKYQCELSFKLHARKKSAILLTMNTFFGVSWRIFSKLCLNAENVLKFQRLFFRLICWWLLFLKELLKR